MCSEESAHEMQFEPSILLWCFILYSIRYIHATCINISLDIHFDIDVAWVYMKYKIKQIVHMNPVA